MLTSSCCFSPKVLSETIDDTLPTNISGLSLQRPAAPFGSVRIIAVREDTVEETLYNGNAVPLKVLEGV